MRLTEDEREQKDEQHLEVRRYNSGHSIRQAHIGLDIGGRFTEGICIYQIKCRSLASVGMTLQLYAPRVTSRWLFQHLEQRRHVSPDFRHLASQSLATGCRELIV